MENPAAIYEGLKYTVREINERFKIKVSGINFTGEKVHKLVGVSGLVELIGTELSNSLLTRAFNCKSDKEICKLRRGLKITFYYY